MGWVKQQRSNAVANAVSHGKSADAVMKDYSQMLKSQIYRDLSDEGEIFFLKVCEITGSEANSLGRVAVEEAIAA